MPPKWVIDRTRSLTIRNTQLRLCEIEQQPLVHIEPGRKYATLVLDMVSIPIYSITEEGQSAIEEIFRDSGAWIASVGRHYCSAKRVPISDAESVATRIFDIAVRCKKLRQAS